MTVSSQTQLCLKNVFDAASTALPFPIATASGNGSRRPIEAGRKRSCEGRDGFWARHLCRFLHKIEQGKWKRSVAANAATSACSAACSFLVAHGFAVFIGGTRRACRGVDRIGIRRFGSGVFYRAIVQMLCETRPSRLMRHAALIHHHPGDTLYRQGNEEEAQEKCSEPLAHVMNLAYAARRGHTLYPRRQNMKVKLSVSSRSAALP